MKPLSYITDYQVYMITNTFTQDITHHLIYMQYKMACNLRCSKLHTILLFVFFLIIC